MRGKLFVFYLWLAAAATIFAQTEKSVLRGVVKDSSGASVPGAEVVATESSTNIQARRVTSDADGNYEIPDLKPTTYRVKADAPGFRSFIAKDVLLDAGQVRRVDMVLEVGATSESVTVEGGAAVIQTDSGTISQDLNTAKLYPDAPMVDNYPSPLALMTTTPGVQGNGWNVVMSGLSDRNKQTYAMDGVANDTTGDQNDNPNFFEVVQVTTVDGGADTARAANFNMVSKHGSNAFHGDVYYKHENSALNAKDWFATTKTPYIFHEFEVQASGPIIKDRTFFFAGWMRQVIPLGSYQLESVPTQLMRSGNFSQFGPIKDPTTGQPFPGNIIPADRIISVSQAVLNQYLPAPNVGGPNTLTNNYGWVFPYNSDLYKGDWPFVRIDHKLTSKNNLYVRWMRRFTPYVGVGPELALTTTKSRDHRQTVASDTYVLSPNLVNSFTFGYQTDVILQGEQEKGVQPITADAVVKNIGLQGVNANGYHTQGFPSMTISGLTTLATSRGGGLTDNVDSNNGINTFEDTLTWSKGKHILKAGMEAWHLRQLNGDVNNQTYGAFNFNGSITGNGFADFLLGLPYSSTRLNPLVNRASTQNQFGAFITDTFKVTSRLTLDYGLRWDYYGSPTYQDGLMYNWDPSTGNVIVAPGTLSKITPLYPTSTIKVTEGKVVPNPDLHNFRPRISAAYRLTDKTVLRGGYGEFTESEGYFNRLLGGGPFQLAETYFNTITNGVPLLSFPNPFPNSLALATVPGQSIQAWPLQTVNGAIRQYNFTIEREFHGLGLRASYIGSRGSGMNYTLNVNKPPASTTPFTPSRNPFPQFISTTVDRNNGSWRYNSLQLEMQRRVGSVTFDANYTWSNNMNNYGITEDPYNVTNRWQRDSYDRRQYFVVSGIWAVPVGKGRRFMSSLPFFVDEFLGGWNLQSITTLASGQYFSPLFTGTNPANTNTSGGLPDRIANGNLPADKRSDMRWFDPTAFAIPQPGHYGNSGGNILVGPGIVVQHLSVAKDFSMTERIKLTFTGQISNLFNHPTFSTPPNQNINQPNPGMFTSEVPYYNPERQGARQIALKLRLRW